MWPHAWPTLLQLDKVCQGGSLVRLLPVTRRVVLLYSQRCLVALAMHTFKSWLYSFFFFDFASTTCIVLPCILYERPLFALLDDWPGMHPQSQNLRHAATSAIVGWNGASDS